MAQRLPPGMPAGRSHHRRGHHPQPAAAPRRLGADMARTPAGQPDRQQGRPSPHLRGELPGHIRAPWELLGPARVHPEARRISPELHTTLLQALHRTPERCPVRDRTCVPRGHDLPGPRARARVQPAGRLQRVVRHRH
jgi:hypothetical protein